MPSQKPKPRPPIDLAELTPAALAKLLDHSVLGPQHTADDARRGAEIAAQYEVASYCIKPCYVPLAVDQLRGTGIPISTVIGFPHGSSTSRAKALEAEDALANGAVELDMVINLGALRSGALDQALEDVAAVVEAARGRGSVKVILETGLLTEEEIKAGCHIVERAGAVFAKTSTGFGPRGASVEDVRLMRSVLSPATQIKAAGGIRSYAAARDLIAAGATRLGTSATEVILKEAGEARG